MISNFFKSEIGAVWQHHRLFLLVLLIGGLLRFWQLPTHMIFFGDAGRDFLEAVEMIKTNKPPLLGIPSSVPRFRQGPVTIWIVGATMLLLGNHPVVIGTIFASLSCITLILLYFLLEEQVNKVVALTASLIFAVSPLAVAHARMPYHISPIPLFTILYLYSLVKLWQHPTPKRIFLATLAWTLLFQFELAVFPLLLLVPYVIFKQAKLKISNLKSFTPALLIGLFPQLIYDLSNRFEHLGGFAVWMVYRIVALAGYGGEHTIGFDRVVNTLEIFSLYFGRILFV